MIKFSTLIVLLLYISYGFGQTVDFSYRSIGGSYCTPTRIAFVQTATGNPIGYVWTFGNNTGSNAANPVATYNSAGTFTVKLLVIYRRSTIQISKTITVNAAVVASFESNRNEICSPGSINFQSTTEGDIAAYEWDFGDGAGMVTTTNPVITHSFSNYSTYPVSMKAISSTGCYGQATDTIKVDRPTVSGTVSILTGCIPASVNFQANVGLFPSSSVTNYKWNFGDGSPIKTTTVANTSHNYITTGRFTPSVHITTNEGCTNDYTFEQLAFGTAPTNSIAYTKDAADSVFCGSKLPYLVAKATNANKYFWDFGFGDTTSVTDTIIQHKFKRLGIQTVTVTPLYNDCPGSPATFTVNVIGVIAGYTHHNTCNDKKTFSFYNITLGNQSTITWNFGDGSNILHSSNVVHSYPDTGTFITTIKVTDSITGCSDTHALNIYTANPLLINPDSSLCKNSNTSFSIPHNYNNPTATYNWNVIGLQENGNTVPLTVTAGTHGHFNNNFVVIDNGASYCPDTIKLSNNIIVRGPILDFNAQQEICRLQTYNISNLSSAYIPTDAINYWRWDYGIAGQFDSVFQPQPYLFPYQGTFDVKLTAIDINGCMDSLVKKASIIDIPFLRSIPDVDTICAGQSSTLIAFHNDPVIWSSSSPLNCTSCDTIIVRPSATTTYFVKTTNRFNCSSIDSIQIFVYTPFTATALKTDNYICQNEKIHLEVNSHEGKRISWSPASGLSDSTIFNPQASPKVSSNYLVTLTDSVGCFSSSTTVNVFVKSLPTVELGSNKTYPYYTNFSFAPFYSNNVRTYEWTPAEQLSCNNCAIPTGLATGAQHYNVKVTSDSGCVATDKISIFIECRDASLLLPTAFTPNNDNLNDYYHPITRGIQKIIRFAIYNRQGQLVFEAKNFDPGNKSYGWDGKLKGADQTSAAYVYEVQAICDAGEQINKRGSFMLIR